MTGEFKKLDYGKDGNMEHYGQPTPPKWDLNNIKMKVHLIGGDEDLLCVPKDVMQLRDNLKAA